MAPRQQKGGGPAAARESIRKRLAGEREALLLRLNGERRTTERVDAGVQPSEDAAEDVAKDVACHEQQSLLARLRSVDLALVRVEDGTYGTCQECGGRIAPRRLELDPAAILCVSCQSATEAGLRTPKM